jgi:hypothetical protein
MQPPRKLFARPWRVIENPESFCIIDGRRAAIGVRLLRE